MVIGWLKRKCVRAWLGIADLARVHLGIDLLGTAIRPGERFWFTATFARACVLQRLLLGPHAGGLEVEIEHTGRLIEQLGARPVRCLPGDVCRVVVTNHGRRPVWFSVMLFVQDDRGLVYPLAPEFVRKSWSEFADVDLDLGRGEPECEHKSVTPIECDDGVISAWQCECGEILDSHGFEP